MVGCFICTNQDRLGGEAGRAPKGCMPPALGHRSSFGTNVRYTALVKPLAAGAKSVLTSYDFYLDCATNRPGARSR